MSEKKTVLIAEDEEPMLNILNDRLKLEGLEVIPVTDGKEALEMALEKHPDLILLDLVMPVMNGAEMLTELMKDEWGSKAKVMCLTNVEDIPESVSEHMKSHPNISYVVKVHTRLDSIIERIKGELSG